MTDPPQTPRPSGVVDFGTLVRFRREQALLTQEQLAQRAGLSARTVRAVESGRIRRPRSTSLRLLADALGLTGTEREELVAAARPGSPEPDDGQPPAGYPVVPAQLPPDPAAFTGRLDQLRRLDTLLPPGNGSVEPVPIAVISGTAGIGKTALAVHWAHRVADQYPGGQLFIDLQGFTHATEPAEAVDVLDRLLRMLGVPGERIPAELADRAALWRSVLAGQRLLIVLDNARVAGQVRPLLPGAASCLTLITSRNQLPGLVATEGAVSLTLDVLPAGDSRRLLERRLGTDRVAAEPGAVDALVGACSGLALALCVVAAQAATRSNLRLADLAQELREAHLGLEPWSSADPASNIRTVFSCSYRALGAETARLFRLLGLHPGPELTAPVAASIAGIPQPATRRLLAELATAHLITERSPGRYTFHDLLRAYAAELVDVHEPHEVRQAATGRMLDFYVHTAHQASMLLNPHRVPIPIDVPHPELRLDNIRHRRDALAWFAIESPALLAAQSHAAGAGFDAHTWQLAWGLVEFLERQRRFQEMVRTQETALAAAQRLGDLPALAISHRVLGKALTFVDSYDAAYRNLTQALRLLEQLGDPVGQARTHISLGVLLDQQGRSRDAIAHVRQGVALFRKEDDRYGLANALNGLGWLHTRIGDHRLALDYCREALASQQEIGDQNGQARTWDSLGTIHHSLGEFRDAATCYTSAIELAEETGDRDMQADALTSLGNTILATGDRGAARQVWQSAVDLLDQLHSPDAEKVRKLLANLDAD